MAAAGAGEILVSATTRQLAAGSGLEFTTRGERELKGLDGLRELFAAGAAPTGSEAAVSASRS
jgi:class 3 adenylate cyclase